MQFPESPALRRARLAALWTGVVAAALALMTIALDLLT